MKETDSGLLVAENRDMLTLPEGVELPPEQVLPTVQINTGPNRQQQRALHRQWKGQQRPVGTGTKPHRKKRKK